MTIGSTLVMSSFKKRLAMVSSRASMRVHVATDGVDLAVVEDEAGWGAPAPSWELVLVEKRLWTMPMAVS